MVAGSTPTVGVLFRWIGSEGQLRKRDFHFALRAETPMPSTLPWVRRSPRGCDNSGSTFGVGIFVRRFCLWLTLQGAARCPMASESLKVARSAYGSSSSATTKDTGDMASMTLWPSGLRRWLKAPFRQGVGSNPTGVTFSGTPALPLPGHVRGNGGSTPCTIASLAQLVRAWGC